MKTAQEIMLQVRTDYERRMELDPAMQPRLAKLVVLGAVIFFVLLIAVPVVRRVLPSFSPAGQILEIVIGSLLVLDIYRRRRR